MVNSKTIATMKNLFKNLMLVAVAAMAFTACSEDNNEVNEVAKKTVISGVLNIVNDDTRSGFTGSYTEGEETYYQSAWDGGETIKIFVDGVDPVTTTIDAEGKFTAKFEGELPESFFMTVCSPADAWDSQSQPTIAHVQTPRANSVDPVAHILQAQNVYVTNGSADAANMGHQVAYGKMTVNDVDFEISKVELSLVGLPNSYWTDNQTYSYTINANEVEGNVFWFATEAMQIVKEFTVTAYGEGDSVVTKTVDIAAAGKTLSFNYGRVSTFSVSGLEKPAEKFDSTYAYVYDGSVEYNDISYMFVADDNSGVRIDFIGIIEDKTIPAGTYTFSESYGMYPNWCYYYPDVDSWNSTKLKYGQAVVSVEDGQYKIVFTNLADGNANVVVEKFTFKGELPGLDIPDQRAKLATPELSYTNEDKVVTLSWNAIEGVEYYSVECDSDAIEDFTTTEKSATITLPEYGAYNFSVAAKVAETNENYRSSDPATVMVVVKDPNAWADYEMTSVAVSGSYVTMTDVNDNRVTFFMNSADRIGNGIKLGNYSYIYSETPAVGQFCVYIVAYDGTYKWSYQIGSGSMSVEEVNGEYKILITVDGIRFGYIGTEVLGAPITGPTIIAELDTLSFVQAGGEKTVNLVLANLTEDVTVTSTNDHFTASVSGSVLTVEAVQEATITLSANGVSATVSVEQEAYNPNAAVEDGTEANPYTIKTAYTSDWQIHFADASNGDSFQMDVNNTDMRVWIRDHGADTWIKFSSLLYSSGANLYTRNGTVYYIDSYAGYSYIKLSCDSSTSTYTCDFKMSVDGGSTYTYYRYVGTISGQQ